MKWKLGEYRDFIEVYWGYIGIMEKRMETTSISGLYLDDGKENGNYYSILGLCRNNGKEIGNYYSILGLYRDNGKENGNYHSILGLYRDNEKNGNYHSILGLYGDTRGLQRSQVLLGATPSRVAFCI